MTHVAIADVTDVVAIQPGAVVSKVVHRDEDLDVTVFGFDAGEGLTEHTASRPAIVQVLSGRLRFTVEGDEAGCGTGVLDLDGTRCHALAPRGGAHRHVADLAPTVIRAA